MVLSRAVSKQNASDENMLAVDLEARAALTQNLFLGLKKNKEIAGHFLQNETSYRTFTYQMPVPIDHHNKSVNTKRNHPNTIRFMLLSNR